MKNKKGQLQISDAPGVVMIVLFLFMVLGTSAYVLDRYADSMGSTIPGNAINESLSQVNEAGVMVANYDNCSFQDFSVSLIVNDSATTAVIPTNNYTVGSDGRISYVGLGAEETGSYNTTDWNVTYTYNYGGKGCEIMEDLETEIEDNISIAGMVLTISLIGIVLSILVGVFFVFTRGRGV